MVEYVSIISTNCVEEGPWCISLEQEKTSGEKIPQRKLERCSKRSKKSSLLEQKQNEKN